MTLTIELEREIEDRLRLRASTNGMEIDEYVRRLIVEDSDGLRSFDEIFAALRENVSAADITEAELEEIVEKARNEV